MTLTDAAAASDLNEVITAGHDQLWQALGACGTWWSGADRVAAMPRHGKHFVVSCAELVWKS